MISISSPTLTLTLTLLNDMCPSNGLLGPPEIHALPPPTPTPTTTTDSGDPFMSLMDASFNNPTPPMGLTENLSPTFLSTGNPLLDFFFQVVPSTPSSTVTALLSSAWDREPLKALKLICQLRGVRGTGKSDRQGFYAAALWLHSNHPKTLALNIASFAEFGYMKDLLEILFRLVQGSEARKIAEKRQRKAISIHCRRGPFFYTQESKSAQTKKSKKESGTREVRIAADLARAKIESDKAGEERRRKRADMALRALEKYSRDPEYRFLHDRVADFFAGLLKSDLEEFTAGRVNKIGLAAKWCPTLDSSFDRSTLLCESIARRMFPRESKPEYLEIDERHYAYRVRDRLRREVLVPLRDALELPEVYMTAGRWAEIPYSRVASVAMKNYKGVFSKHDKDRFAGYLVRVKEGKANIAAGALLPHEIATAALRGEDDEVAELQWQRMVDDLLKLGKLSNCIAVCDVSGSMTGTPMEVCVALGILVSELSEEPWKGRVITFSSNPELHTIAGATLKEKAKFVSNMDWGMNTDFQRVFDRILQASMDGKLPAEKMIKRVLVFSDMEFDQASANPWETDYRVICEKFQRCGYGEAVPEIVFWNLRDSTSVPVTAEQKGVALVSGFSKNVLKLFLDGDGIVDPESLMDAAIAGDEYQKLVVFD